MTKQFKPGDLAVGLPPIYVNHHEVSVLDNSEMVRFLFASITGPEGVSHRALMMMTEHDAQRFANNILTIIREREKRVIDRAKAPKPPGE